MNEMNFIKQFREEVVQSRNEMKHYKFLYQAVARNNTHLSCQLRKIKNRLQNSENMCKHLQHQVNSLQGNAGKEPRKIKAWCRLKSDKTKRLEIVRYRDMLLNNIKNNVKHCKGANIALQIGDKNVQYSWKPNKVMANRNNGDKMSTHLTEHSYAKNNNMSTDDEPSEDIYDVDYSKIFDDNGNWHKKHTRGHIHVIDNYRISHKAYHELRLAGKGHFPPLTTIMREKSRNFIHKASYCKY